MQQVPKYAMYEILSNLSYPDILNYCKTHKVPYCNDEEFWEFYVKNVFGIDEDHVSGTFKQTAAKGAKIIKDFLSHNIPLSTELLKIIMGYKQYNINDLFQEKLDIPYDAYLEELDNLKNPTYIKVYQIVDKYATAMTSYYVNLHDTIEIPWNFDFQFAIAYNSDDPVIEGYTLGLQKIYEVLDEHMRTKYFLFK
jgi:hypothetical protein